MLFLQKSHVKFTLTVFSTSNMGAYRALETHFLLCHSLSLM